MNDYLEDLHKAFLQVNSRYFFTEVVRDMNNYDDKNKVKQMTENSFTAELFRHWRNIMESKEDRTLYEHLALDFDIRKSWWSDDIKVSQKSFRPDLVLHKSQLEYGTDNQKVYIEVKTNPNPRIKNDILKLINSQNTLEFEKGVFISINSNYNNLVNLIRSFVNLENQRLIQKNIIIDWNNIYLFHSRLNGDGRMPSDPISFQQIINL
jgi:hypothetical protein